MPVSPEHHRSLAVVPSIRIEGTTARLRRDYGGAGARQAGLSQGMAEVMRFVMGPCLRNRFLTSPWPPGSCGVADGQDCHRAQGRLKIPIRIPN
jgi:hypothetical protein